MSSDLYQIISELKEIKDELKEVRSENLELKKLIKSIKKDQDDNEICGDDKCLHPKFLHKSCEYGSGCTKQKCGCTEFE
jgi:hypothetical protein